MNLRETMLAEQQLKALFEQAKGYAFEYAEAIADRAVFPTPQAIADLEQFVEAMPGHPGDASSILQQLHDYGSPASVPIRNATCPLRSETQPARSDPKHNPPALI